MHSFDVGRQFIRYYRDEGFKALPGGSLLDPSVPMTFVMSAGLTQIESTVEQSENHAGERYVLLQTCFRHFDLERIGQSPLHLSLFGMSGAFSFGTTSRDDTIGKIWRFLTGELGFRGEQLVATCFVGGELDGHKFEQDVETVQAWQRIGLRPSQIVGAGIDASFWKQGGGISGKERIRKCGPTTELFFDRGSGWSCGLACQPGCGCERFVEIANVLFIHSQIDQATQSLSPLATPFDETVIGIERVAMLLQKKSSVFELECMAPLVKLVHFYQATDTLGSGQGTKSEWVIADHVRALLFLTADGAPPPGKGGRSGIIRKLIRATLTHQKILGIPQGTFISDLVSVILDLYQGQHLNLVRGREPLLACFAAESKRFERTLSAGYRRLDRFVQRGGNGAISGQQALDLVKLRGIPLSLLETELALRGIKLDKQEYWEAYARWEQATARTR